MHEPTTLRVSLRPASLDDLERLATLRIAAMRESLERVGRFDLARARARLADGYSPQHTRHIVGAGRDVGFVVVRPRANDWLLDHLYIEPRSQGLGIGGLVLSIVFAEADAAEQSLSVHALRESRSNDFYRRQGFELVGESEFDLEYVRVTPRLELQARESGS